jgi:DNA repair protein RecO (recombination protein O)
MVTKKIVNENISYQLNSQLENRNIPNFLIENSFSASDDDLSKGLKLVGDFLEKSILRPNNLIQPSNRLHFINTLK